MKTILYCIIVLILFTGCEKQPTAKFEIYSDNYWTFEPVTFKNLSFESYYYEWNINDTISSNSFNITHYFEKPGTYTISLTAFSENRKKKDVFTNEIIITQPTDLVLKIDAKSPNNIYSYDSFYVSTFNNLQDYELYTNIIDSVFTDIKGIAVLRDVPAQVYYVDIFKKEESGYWSNIETGYVTEELNENEVNYYEIDLIYYDEVK